MPKPALDIAYLFAENARARIKEVAQIVKKSPQRVKYSLGVLEKEEYLHMPHAVFDYSYMGLLMFRAYFSGGYINEEEKAAIIQSLEQNPYVVGMYEMSSGYDLVVEMVAPNPSRFNKEIKKIASLPNLSNYTPIVNVVSHIYPKQYLASLVQNVPKEIIIGGDRDVLDFTENEMLMIKALSEHPRQRIVKIAKTLGMHVRTANAVIKSLKNKKFLKGFKFVINSNKLGVRKVRLFLGLHNISADREEELLDFCLKTEEIVQLNKTIGDWDIEIDIASFDEQRIRVITAQIRQSFKDLIQSFATADLYNLYKKSYLPRYLWIREEPVDPSKSAKNLNTMTPLHNNNSVFLAHN